MLESVEFGGWVCETAELVDGLERLFASHGNEYEGAV